MVLPGCSDSADNAEPGSEPSSIATLVPEASPAPSADTAAIKAIPAPLQGRWGLVPADCTSTRGDAKGLVTIDASSMKFYESVAVLKAIRGGNDRKVRASFAYSGEGMAWTRETVLEAMDGGASMVLEEFGDDAPKGARTYTRCS